MCNRFGTKRNTKTDEFSEKFPRGGGGGSFSIQKFILQISAIINSTYVMNSGKNLQYDFPKMRGSKAVWNFSENSSVLVLRGFPKSKFEFFFTGKVR